MFIPNINAQSIHYTVINLIVNNSIFFKWPILTCKLYSYSYTFEGVKLDSIYKI